MDTCKYNNELIESYNILKKTFPNIAKKYILTIDDIIDDKKCQTHFYIMIKFLRTLVYSMPKCGSTSMYMDLIEKTNNKFFVCRTHQDMVADYMYVSSIYQRDEYYSDIKNKIGLTSLLAIIYIIFIKKSNLHISCIYRNVEEQIFSQFFYNICNYLFHKKYNEKINSLNDSIIEQLIFHIDYYIRKINVFLEYKEILCNKNNVSIELFNIKNLPCVKNVNNDIYYDRFKIFTHKNPIFMSSVKKILYSNQIIKEYINFFQPVIEDEDCNFRQYR